MENVATENNGRITKKSIGGRPKKVIKTFSNDLANSQA